MKPTEALLRTQERTYADILLYIQRLRKEAAALEALLLAFENMQHAGQYLLAATILAVAASHAPPQEELPNEEEDEKEE